MGIAVKRILVILLAGTAAARADFTPAAWHSAPLETAGAANEWYLFPQSTKEPRVLVKASANNNSAVARKLLTGGPPVWTADASASLGLINKQGTFVPTPTGGGYLVASHGNAGSAVLKVVIFNAAGSPSLETIDPNPGTYTGISAELDAAGVLHVGYVFNGSTVCYARRAGGNPWLFTSVPNTGAVHDTAVIPVPSTEEINGVTRQYETFLYFTATASNVRTLWRYRPGILNNQLLIQWGTNPRANIENFVGLYLRGSRVGNTSRLYFFGSEGTNSWKLKRYAGSGTPTELEVAGNVNPKAIRVAMGPDGRQRVAWYNATNNRVHYLRPTPGGVDLPILAGFPVTTTGSQADADLLGFHFDAAGLPYLLYRTTYATGFMAFPNDNFDTNGNGRADVIDHAFLSTTAGLEMLPVEPAASGIAGSANRFKFRFPTVGGAGNNGTGGVTSSQKNLIYSIETSTNGSTWTPVTGVGSVAYYLTATTGTGANEVRTYTGVLPGDAPGGVPAKFARMTVVRSPSPY